MSIVFACLPESLKAKVKETFPEVTFFKADELDESVHGKPRKKRGKKVPVEVKDVADSVPPL